jgi:hypothetical protein
MDYNKIYINLVNKGRNRNISGYMERHHIIPKCLGGSDEVINLVYLTPEEHFLAHQLLVKIHAYNPKLVYACVRMTQHNSGLRINNKLYGWLKRKRSEVVSKQSRLMWEEKRPEIINSMKKYCASEIGKKQRSDSAKKAWQDADSTRRQQVKDLQKEFNDQVAQTNRELWKTEEYRIKMSKRKTRGSDGSKLKEKWADPIWRQKMLDARKIKLNETK